MHNVITGGIGKTKNAVARIYKTGRHGIGLWVIKVFVILSTSNHSLYGQQIEDTMTAICTSRQNRQVALELNDCERSKYTNLMLYMSDRLYLMFFNLH